MLPSGRMMSDCHEYAIVKISYIVDLVVTPVVLGKAIPSGDKDCNYEKYCLLETT